MQLIYHRIGTLQCVHNLIHICQNEFQKNVQILKHSFTELCAVVNHNEFLQIDPNDPTLSWFFRMPCPWGCVPRRCCGNEYQFGRIIFQKWSFWTRFFWNFVLWSFLGGTDTFGAPQKGYRGLLLRSPVGGRKITPKHTSCRAEHSGLLFILDWLKYFNWTFGEGPRDVIPL